MLRTSLVLRKLFAAAIFGFTSVLALAADKPAGKVVVMTSYPEEVVARFEAAFEKAHPGTRVEILWRRSGDALSYLRKPNQGDVDVYWTPAQRNFQTLAKEGAFRQPELDMTGLPAKVGGFPISDPAGYYLATEIAGYGFALNPQRLQDKKLAPPKQWTDLTGAAWKDEIVFPVPGKVGFAPLLIDIILQGYGWDKGWALLQAIGSNAQLLGEGGPNISDEVRSGRVSVGVSIDFFIKSAIANGAPIQFTYPGITGYSPAHVGIMKGAPNLAAARAFVRFVLSDEGQKILFHQDIRKLPVRPAVYASKPDGYYDPFVAAQAMPFVFDTERALARQGLNNTLFDVLISNEHARLRQANDKVMQAEAAAHTPVLKAKAAQARSLLDSMPLTEAEANALAPQFVFAFDETSDARRNDAITTLWTTRIRDNRTRAEQLAQEVLNATGKQASTP
ncbi:Phosphoglycerate transport regulatory protein PgtC precursor [compost metagenome]